MALDFGYTGDSSANDSNAPAANNNSSGTTDLTTGNVQNDVNGLPADDINSISDSGDSKQTKPTGTGAVGASFDNGDNNAPTPAKPVTSDPANPANPAADAADATTTPELAAGAVIEIGTDKYTVDDKGNVLDKDGNTFKEAKDVKSWLETFDNVSDGSDSTLSIDTIKETVGIEITDDNDQPIDFENTPAGVKAYIDAVTETNRDSHYEEAINNLYRTYPIIPDILNYYVANGNSLEGFGEIQDRSTITIDDTNEAQQESIIRTAWTEQNRKGEVDGYINYLKSNGTLLATAKEELAGLQENDRQTKEELATKAAEAEEANLKTIQKYWAGVQEVITNRKIAGYEIPDTIVINRDGKRQSATPNDFYNFVYQIDKDGKSAYEKELAKETPESRRDDELLRAYLKFVGGNYSNLVSMAVNKDKVATLKLSAKQRSTSTIKVTNPNANANQGANKDFGYN